MMLLCVLMLRCLQGDPVRGNAFYFLVFDFKQQLSGLDFREQQRVQDATGF